MAKLFLMAGIPGSGKTTFAKRFVDNHSKHISRDVIRFSIISEDDKYFAKENLVFDTFVKQINAALMQGYNVYADATHLNEKSRNKLLRRIIAPTTEIDVIWIKTDLNTALDRNENRAGTRAYVPPTSIASMYNSFRPPTFKERFDKIYIVEDDQPMKVYYRNGVCKTYDLN